MCQKWRNQQVFPVTCDHDCADVCLSEDLQYSGSLGLQLILHNDQPQELHVGLNVIPGDEDHCMLI